jgi:hypothetical protein
MQTEARLNKTFNTWTQFIIILRILLCVLRHIFIAYAYCSFLLLILSKKDEAKKEFAELSKQLDSFDR